jgi:hypothetical protein
VRRHNLVDVFELLEVVWNAETLAASFFDKTLGLVCVLLLLRKIDNRDIAAFTGVESGYRTTGGSGFVSKFFFFLERA